MGVLWGIAIEQRAEDACLGVEVGAAHLWPAERGTASLGAVGEGTPLWAHANQTCAVGACVCVCVISHQKWKVGWRRVGGEVPMQVPSQRARASDWRKPKGTDSSCTGAGTMRRVPHRPRRVGTRCRKRWAPPADVCVRGCHRGHMISPCAAPGARRRMNIA